MENNFSFLCKLCPLAFKKKIRTPSESSHWSVPWSRASFQPALQSVQTRTGANEEVPERVLGNWSHQPIILVQGKRRRTDLCRNALTYRGLSDIMAKNRYPLSLRDAAFTALRQAWIFIKLDLKNAYNLVWIWWGDEWKVVFNTPVGHFDPRWYYLVWPRLLQWLLKWFCSSSGQYIEQVFLRKLAFSLWLFMQSQCRGSPHETSGCSWPKVYKAYRRKS